MNTLKTTLHALLQDLVGSETIIYANQNSPRPPMPYWTVHLRTNKALGDEYFSQGVNDAGEQQVDGVRELTLHIQRYGNGSDIACAVLRDKFSLTTVRQRWAQQHLIPFNTGDVLDIPFRMDMNRLEPRASVDVFLRFGIQLMDAVGWLEIVNVTDTDAP